MAGRLLQESARRQVGQVSNKGYEDSNTPRTQTAFSANGPSPNYHSHSSRGGFHATSRGRGGFRGGTRGYHRSISSDRGNKGLGTTRTPPATKCDHCGMAGHWKKDCFKRKAEETGNQPPGGSGEFTFLAQEPQPSILRLGWIIESGASQDLCGIREAFSTHTSLGKAQAITIADGTKIKAEGVGPMEMVTQTISIKLTDVWHVPGVGGNLMSVSQMVDAGYRVELGSRPSYVSNTGIQTVLGYQFGSRYYLNTE